MSIERVEHKLAVLRLCVALQAMRNRTLERLAACKAAPDERECYEESVRLIAEWQARDLKVEGYSLQGRL